MKCFFQLIDAGFGERTAAVSCSRDEFAKRLAKMLETSPDMGEMYVLVLIEDLQIDAVTDWQFSRAPLMRVNTFVQQFNN